MAHCELRSMLSLIIRTHSVAKGDLCAACVQAAWCEPSATVNVHIGNSAVGGQVAIGDNSEGNAANPGFCTIAAEGGNGWQDGGEVWVADRGTADCKARDAGGLELDPPQLPIRRLRCSDRWQGRSNETIADQCLAEHDGVWMYRR